MLRSDHLQRIAELSRAAYPDEACGLIVVRSWDEARLVEMENLQDRYHARDPVRFPRTARTAYAMHPLRLSEAVEAGGGLLCIWHSHCDVGAYFSDEDVRVALGGGDEPLWPGTDYLVVSCRTAGVDDLRLFRWDAAAGRYEGSELPVPPGGA
jgi:proteasome lid subunit RPN8/RPN11